MKIPDFLFRRPLFYAAILLSAGIVAAPFIFPGILDQIPKNDVYRLVKKGPQSVSVRGQILSEVEEKENAYREKYDTFILSCRSMAAEDGSERPLVGKIKVTVKNPAVSFQYGDRVALTGELALPPGLRNPGGFNYQAYLDRQGIRAVLFCDKHSRPRVEARPGGNFFLDRSYRFRRFLSENLSEGFPAEDAAFLKALLLGEKSGISADFEDLFIKTGTLHILAVSGFNVGFLSAVVLFFLAPLRLPKNLKWTFVLIVLWIYCLLVGWQAPLVRASVMASILICGKLLGKKTDLLNSLGLAAILLLALNPKNIFDIGFQLSFLAVAGLALFMPFFMPKQELFPNEKWTRREKIVTYAKELFWVSFVATFVTLPITVQSFYLVTPLSLLANMIVVPLSFWLFFCGIVYFLTFWWVPKTLFFIPWIMKFLMQLFIRSLSWVGELPLSCITVGKLHPALEVLLIAGLFYLFFDKKIISPIVRAALVFIFSLNIFLFQDALRHFDRQFKMTVLDVGQGDAIYFEFPEGGNLLVDAGKGPPRDMGRWVVAPFLKSKGIRSLDALVISHPQADHIGGMSTVLREFSVKNVLDSKIFYRSHLYQSLQNEILKENARYLKAGRGMEIDGFRGVSIEVLNPDPKRRPSKNINNECVVLKIIYGNTSFLLTGDVEAPGMSDILESGADIRADVLKVPHHGAKLNATGREFVESVAPKISVISVGRRNPFGHPRPETLDALASISGNRIFRTDRHGAVSVTSDGVTVRSTPFVMN